MIRKATTVVGRIDEIESAADLSLLHSLCLLHVGEVAAAIEAIERGRQRLVPGGAEPADVGVVLAGGATIVWIFTCTLASAIVVAQDQVVGVVHIEALTSRALAVSVEALTGAASPAAADAALEELDRLLTPLLQPLRAFLVEHPSADVNVVAAGTLARVPLHALSHTGVPPLVESATVRFLPTVQTAARLRARTARIGERIAIVDPEGDLDGAKAEAHVVGVHHHDVRLPPADTSLRAWLDDVLPSTAHLHLACHATVGASAATTEFRLGDPRTLTLAHLLDADLPVLESVIAAACGWRCRPDQHPTSFSGSGTACSPLGQPRSWRRCGKSTMSSRPSWSPGSTSSGRRGR